MRLEALSSWQLAWEGKAKSLFAGVIYGQVPGAS